MGDRKYSRGMTTMVSSTPFCVSLMAASTSFGFALWSELFRFMQRKTLKLSDIESLYEFKTNFWFVKNRKELTDSAATLLRGYELTIVDEQQLRRLLDRLLSPEEFLSDFGIRSLSRYSGQHPFVFGQGEVRLRSCRL